MHIHNLKELQRRKEALKGQIEQEKGELQETVRRIKDELTPANMIRKAVTTFLNPPATDAPDGPPQPGQKLVAPVQMLVDLLVRNRVAAGLLRQLAPAAIQAIPKLAQKAGDALPDKAVVYENLRKRVAKLRNRIHPKKED